MQLPEPCLPGWPLTGLGWLILTVHALVPTVQALATDELRPPSAVRAAAEFQDRRSPVGVLGDALRESLNRSMPATWAEPLHDSVDADRWALCRFATDDCDQENSAHLDHARTSTSSTDVWMLQVMPDGLLYQSYLAGVKEPRFASTWTNDARLGEIWDAAVGGRIGVLRFGSRDSAKLEGWQIDLEGGAQARLDPHDNSTALLSVDFRAGIPVTYARGPWQFKTGYSHISSHLGDEFLLMYPTARRINYTRDSILLGVGYFLTDSLRLYAETAYALGAGDGAEPLEFQFGADWTPDLNTGIRGAPFLACNGHLREEVGFGGNLVLQGGWCWRRTPRGSLFRLGIQYFRGKSDQYEYYDVSEERFGWGLWLDY